ncbi:MAG: taurine catabolism dioxygenase [Porticoccaceae bacterium]|nr:MAG: taurine catabolism dioxygenase [Porticoccaceae bacterium]
MPFEVVPIKPQIGAEVRTDVATLLGGERAADLRRLLEERVVLVFRDLFLDDAQQVAIARTLGTPLKEGGGEDGVYRISLDGAQNPKADYLRGAFYWHIDGSTQEKPYYATLLRPVVLAPTGGETEFANTAAAYEALPDEEKRALEGLRVVHSMERSLWYVYPEPSLAQVEAWQRVRPKSCPLVWAHASGTRSLLIGATADYVEGLSPEESRRLLVRLREFATQPPFVYRHRWRLGDLVIWNNTAAMHRALPYPADCGRLLIRTTLAGEEAVH